MLARHGSEGGFQGVRGAADVFLAALAVRPALLGKTTARTPPGVYGLDLPAAKGRLAIREGDRGLAAGALADTHNDAAAPAR
ncbi:hypothetical protein [Streptomyces rimosus]|uniref:hypothetical protein n=1 Tax=Streptomyces rimosus TaxID=1927 RepID=UPI000B1BB63D|nr:hypothetical protein [Streptomyces rimosus]